MLGLLWPCNAKFFDLVHDLLFTLIQLAAHYLKKKQSSLDIALSMLVNANEIDGGAESVAPSTFVGQFARLLEQGDALSFQP